ncbi:MAG: hypothetical protein IPO08_20650 [Xanthomonadales bacterium]|nr:hypothetical protein [Xanthomonadales bacterium]
MTFESYQYNPAMTLQQVYDAEGLDKLRGVPDRALAETLFCLYQTLHSPKALLTDRKTQEGEFERRVDYVQKAYAGKFGVEEQDIAWDVFGKALPSVFARADLGAFFRQRAALRQAKANRVTGDE